MKQKLKNKILNSGVLYQTLNCDNRPNINE